MLLKYEYLGKPLEQWHFQQVSLDQINLLVGLSGSGKTRFLNSIFNFAKFVSSGSIVDNEVIPLTSGHWKLEFDVDGKYYNWDIQIIEEERIYCCESLKLRNESEEIEIIRRDKENFYFNNQSLPKIQPDLPSVSILKEEELIRPVYNSFRRIMRRRFFVDALKNATNVENIAMPFLEKIKSTKSLEDLWSKEISVSSKLFILKEYFNEKYETITSFYKSIFPKIKEIDIHLVNYPGLGTYMEGPMPFFVIREEGVERWIRITELSSGMLKVLLIITDIISFPGNNIYLVDEYENSLGINAINFLPSFLLENANNNQFLITTHHPYLINNMPIGTWKVFKQEQSLVTIRDGEFFEDKFGKSKQQAFIQLINDPDYN